MESELLVPSLIILHTLLYSVSVYLFKKSFGEISFFSWKIILDWKFLVGFSCSVLTFLISISLIFFGKISSALPTMLALTILAQYVIGTYVFCEPTLNVNKIGILGLLLSIFLILR